MELENRFPSKVHLELLRLFERLLVPIPFKPWNFEFILLVLHCVRECSMSGVALVGFWPETACLQKPMKPRDHM